MNAQQLRELLDDIEASGQNLQDLPILFIEGSLGIQATEDDVKMVNVSRFNEMNSQQLITQFDSAILFGYVAECD